MIFRKNIIWRVGLVSILGCGRGSATTPLRSTGITGTLPKILLLLVGLWPLSRDKPLWNSHIRDYAMDIAPFRNKQNRIFFSFISSLFRWWTQFEKGCMHRLLSYLWLYVMTQRKRDCRHLYYYCSYESGKEGVEGSPGLSNSTSVDGLVNFNVVLLRIEGFKRKTHICIYYMYASMYLCNFCFGVLFIL